MPLGVLSLLHDDPLLYEVAVHGDSGKSEAVEVVASDAGERAIAYARSRSLEYMP